MSEWEQECVRFVMASPQGRGFVAMVLNFTSPRGNSFSSDPYINAHNQGQRNVGCFVEDVIAQHAGLEALFAVYKEQQLRERMQDERDTAKRTADSGDPSLDEPGF